MPSFSNKKQLRFVIQLGKGTFDASDNNIITFQGFRASATIEKAGGVQMGTLDARIYGVAMQDMNSLTSLQWSVDYATKNVIQVFAIDGEVESMVFSGTILKAWGNYNAPPDVYLDIQANTAHIPLITASKPITFKDEKDVSELMSDIAKAMNFQFENNNVHSKIRDVYLAGTLIDQARELAFAADFDLYINDTTVAITNKYSPRAGDIPEISPESGMIGYPTFDSIGVTLRTMYNPAIIFGGSISVVSAIEKASGQWTVACLSHLLEAETIGGAWQSTIRGVFNGRTAIVK